MKLPSVMRENIPVADCFSSSEIIRNGAPKSTSDRSITFDTKLLLDEQLR